MKNMKKAPVKKVAAKKAVLKKVAPKKPEVKTAVKAKPEAKKSAPVKVVSKKVENKKTVVPKKEAPKPVAKKEAVVAKPVSKKAASDVKPLSPKDEAVIASVKKVPAKKTLTKKITTKVHTAPSKPLATNISSGGKKIFQMEFVIRSSPVILYDFCVATSNLAQWFADEVDRDRDDVYTFTWDGEVRKATVLDEIEHELIRYQWMDAPDDEYLEFKITHTEITGDTVLVITDFALPIDMKDAQFLWDSQVKTMIQQLGA